MQKGGGYVGEPLEPILTGRWGCFKGIPPVFHLARARSIIQSLVGPDPLYDHHAVHTVRGGHEEGQIWNTDDLDDPQIPAILQKGYRWCGNEVRLEVVNRIKLWRFLTGDDRFDLQYWLGRLENQPQGPSPQAPAPLRLNRSNASTRSVTQT